MHSVLSEAPCLGAVAVDIDILFHPSRDLGNREYVDSIFSDMARVRRPSVDVARLVAACVLLKFIWLLAQRTRTCRTWV